MIQVLRKALKSSGVEVGSMTLTYGAPPTVALTIYRGVKVNLDQLKADSTDTKFSLSVRAALKAVVTAESMDAFIFKKGLHRTGTVITLSPLITSNSLSIDLDLLDDEDKETHSA